MIGRYSMTKAAVAIPVNPGNDVAEKPPSHAWAPPLNPASRSAHKASTAIITTTSSRIDRAEAKGQFRPAPKYSRQ